MKMKQPKADESRGSLIHAIQQNVFDKPNHVFLHWVDPKCNIVDSITYQQLWNGTAATAELLIRNGVDKGDRVMIAYPFGPSFLYGFFGCMRIGAIPCSVYPPNPQPSKAKHSFDQFNGQVRDAEAKIALTTASFKQALKLSGMVGHRTPDVKWISTDNLKDPENPNVGIMPQPNDIAFIQYSSGSTGDPKGIMISHKAVLYNSSKVMQHCTDTNGSNVLVSWLPQYHDLGLIVAFVSPALHPFFVAHVASPIDFIKAPILWADMIEKFDATHTMGPNFSYALLAKRMRGAGRVLKRQLRNATITAEPIAPTTIEDMIEIGIPRTSILPAYGLAENCVYVTCVTGDEMRLVDGVVCCGSIERSAGSDKTIAIVDTETGKIITDESRVGEIYIRGPDLSSGYWRRPEQTKETFQNVLEDGEEYCRSGDLGRVIDGQLFVVGRTKELIIVNGRNIYPTDLERKLEEEFSDLVRPGSTVAYQHTESGAGLVFELRNRVGVEETFEKLTPQAVRRIVSDSNDVQLVSITMLRQGAVPKTTSGKLKRVATRHRAINGDWEKSTVVWSWVKTESSSAFYDIGTETAPIETEGESVGSTSRGEVDIIFDAVLGDDFEENMTWTDLGLSSLAHAELSAMAEERLKVKLPVNFHDMFQTPSELKTFILEHVGQRFPVKLDELNQVSVDALPRLVVMIIQGIGILLLLLCLAMCFVVAYVVGQVISAPSILNMEDIGKYEVLLFPSVLLPTFVVSLSTLVICMKWIVIGRYRPENINVFSFPYLRWWFMDRLMDLWELWIGSLVVDTPIICVFYQLLGCKLHLRTEIKAFIREFDLVTIKCDSAVKKSVRCRRFGPWSARSGPTLRFRPVEIGSRCRIDGLVTLGSVVGDDVRIDELSVLAEGAQVGSKSHAVGNPAFDDGSGTFINDRVSSSVLGMKVFWLIVEMYVFLGLFWLSSVLWVGLLDQKWRYATLVFVVLSVLTTSFVSLLVSAGLKWILIRRRQARDRLMPSAWVKFCDWVCDYHFQASSLIFSAFAGDSRIWNILLMLHGLDIDLRSALSSPEFSFPPSVVDQVSVRRSFLANWLRFRAGNNVEIVDSTAGYGSVFSGGVKVHRSTIRVYADVQESVYGDFFRRAHSTWSEIFVAEGVWFVRFLFFCASFVPSFEVYLLMISVESMVLKLVCFVGGLALQSIVWTLNTRLFQSIALVLLKCKEAVPSLSDGWYHALIGIVANNSTWGHWFLLWGTPFYNGLAWLMGATIEGDFLFNGKATHDFHALTFQDKTIVDESQVTGHIQVGQDLTVGASIHSGVLHFGCFTMCGTVMGGTNATEVGPMRPVFERSISNE